MICKNSFYKSVYETIRHHLAAIFATCLVFFIQVVVFFLNLQNYASASYKDYRYECLMNLTLPNTAYVVPIVFIGFLLAFDFFKYLHIKNQVDFYDSLPVCRRDWFLLRSSSAVLIFLIPYSICTLLEMILLAVTGFGTKVFLINLCWVFISMTCIYLSTFLAGTVVMIVTGNPVIGCFGFSFISIYAPYILRYIYPNYASQYFKTYVSDDTKLDFLEYLSPIGQSVKLLSSDYLEWNVKDHVIDFLMILIVIALTGLLAYFLYLHRPSEAAANAIAFKKAASPIRISIVIPFALYIGLYLMQIAEVASKSWMIFGFFISCVLLHGIIESIFQFDIKALWKHKKQMAFSFLTCIGIASLFWIDAFGFNKYLP